MGDQVSLLLEVAVKPGQLDDFTVLMDEMVESTEGEPGAVIYEWSVSDDGGTVHIHERFTDSPAVVTHLATFGAQFAARFLGAVDPTRLVVYGSPSDDAKEALSALGPSYMVPLGGFAR